MRLSRVIRIVVTPDRLYPWSRGQAEIILKFGFLAIKLPRIGNRMSPNSFKWYRLQLLTSIYSTNIDSMKMLPLRFFWDY